MMCNRPLQKPSLRLLRSSYSSKSSSFGQRGTCLVILGLQARTGNQRRCVCSFQITKHSESLCYNFPSVSAARRLRCFGP